MLGNDVFVEFLPDTLGIALIGSVLNSAYQANIEPATSALPPAVAEPVNEGIGGALAVTAQMGADGTALLDSARQAFVDGMIPALLLAAGLSLAAAIYTALRGPKTATEAEPLLHPTDQSDSSG